MWPNTQKTADLVTFTKEILNEKLHFFLQWVWVNIDVALRVTATSHFLRSGNYNHGQNIRDKFKIAYYEKSLISSFPQLLLVLTESFI